MQNMKSSTCTLPPCSDLLAPPPRKSSVLDVNNLLSPATHSNVNDMPTAPVSSAVYHHHHHQQQYYHPYERNVGGYREPTMHSQQHHHQMPLKAKRKRASPAQLSVLNHVFSQTYFPSTELRIELGKQLGMSPRAVQIWFQNKRQSLRTRERQQQERKHVMASSSSPMSSPSSINGNKHHYMQQHHYPYYTNALPPISPPLSPPEQSPYHYQQHSYAEHHRRRSSYELLPLHVPNTPSSASSYASPTSIDSIILH